MSYFIIYKSNFLQEKKFNILFIIIIFSLLNNTIQLNIKLQENNNEKLINKKNLGKEKLKIKSFFSKIETNLLQIKSENYNYLTKKNIILTELTQNRLMRFIVSFIIVLLISIFIFYIIKNSIEWVIFYLKKATNSKMELNKIKSNKLEEITKNLSTKYYYINNNESNIMNVK